MRSGLALLLNLLVLGTPQAQHPQVDFRYAPYRSLNAICFPNDWQKTVVTERHGLGYDFGPGPYGVPLTELTVRALGEELAMARQWMDEPSVPLMRSEFHGTGITVSQEAFAVPLGSKGAIAGRKPQAVRRIQGWNGTISWAHPPPETDPSFRSVAWGVNRPIQYRARVARGSEKLVAFGICEPYKWGPGTRTFDLRVEGSAPVFFDPLASAAKNVPQVVFLTGRDENRDGELEIEVHASLSSPDPNPFLNAFWVYPAGTPVSAQEIISGGAGKKAEIAFDCGAEEMAWQSGLRADMLTAEFAGRAVTPEIRLKTSRRLEHDRATGIIWSEGSPFLLTRPRAESVHAGDGEWRLLLPAGTRRVETIILSGAWSPASFKLVPTAEAARQGAIRFWKEQARIPQGRYVVPDSGIQYTLEASIRNLYQIGELVDGKLQFQPGPSVYRGLWVHDAAWHVSAALYLGDLGSARSVLERLLRFQMPDGRVKVMAPYPMNRETPLFVWLMTRYARLAHDREFLEAHWEAVERAMEWIGLARNETMADPASPFYGLFPPSFADGGVSGLNYEYASVYWALAAYRSGAEAARWLGKGEAARTWDAQFDDLWRLFRKGAARDIRRDAHGNPYLPMRVADTSRTTPPQQGNWAILDAQGIVHMFDPGDSLLTGTLAMLTAETHEGLAPNTGWLKEGLWPFFSTLQAITHLYQRQYTEAESLLYAISNHASPLGTWFEEQLPKEEGQKVTGDGSNATASALYVKLVRRMLLLERGDTLEIFAGVPRWWHRPGAAMALKGAPSLFGAVTASLQISPDGRTGSISLAPVGSGREGKWIVLPLRALRELGYVGTDGSPLPEALVTRQGKSARLSFVKP